MVNIIVTALSPLGDYLCLGNSDTDNLEEGRPVKKQKNKLLFVLFFPSSSITVCSTDLATYHPDFSFAQVHLLSLELHMLA